LIAQHEIGVHLQSFAAGVRNSLRRKPMVILVGESRDADTIDAMILAAQTGHLVYTTAHTNSVPETLTRLVEPFPVSEREGRLAGLLDSLRLIVTQRLVRTVDGRRAAAREYLHQGFEGGQELSGCGSVGLVAQRQQAGHGYMRSVGIVGPLHGRLLGSTRMLAILSQLDLLGRGD
ncbi:MAG: Flp pilus assembly complex ATPase component TadA, partial [Candidatus Competibacteraceae bacterium]|nr:Flp pilus assembly complex ATPase component TadA [Candidatus Competibacteraceae bacterium]